jgi:glycosyltransferase involved in cell wall biosynthesis
MRIGIVSPGDPRSLKIWSGTTSFMCRALERHAGEVVALGPVWGARETWGRATSRLSRALTGRIRPYRQSLPHAREQARLFARRIARRGPLDVLFAPAASEQLAFLETALPVVYTSDTTFALIHDYYDDFAVPGPAGLAAGNELERRALARSDLVLYPSRWPIPSAVRDYGVDEAKVRVVPYGANLERVPPRDAALAPKPEGPLTLLWLGVDWERKGGPIALETVRLLRAGGVDARLVVVGCVPPGGVDAAVRVLPRLDKGVPAQAAELARLLRESHFLFLPTRADCYGIVFCEASAYGTPSLATDTGGVSGAVREGRNGHLLPLDAEASDYAALVRAIWEDAPRYRALCASSRALYDERLNWDAWGREVGKLLEELARSVPRGLHERAAAR